MGAPLPDAHPLAHGESPLPLGSVTSCAPLLLSFVVRALVPLIRPVQVVELEDMVRAMGGDPSLPPAPDTDAEEVQRLLGLLAACDGEVTRLQGELGRRQAGVGRPLAAAALTLAPATAAPLFSQVDHVGPRDVSRGKAGASWVGQGLGPGLGLGLGQVQGQGQGQGQGQWVEGAGRRTSLASQAPRSPSPEPLYPGDLL